MNAARAGAFTEPLPVRALYTLGELAHAASLDRRKLKTLLKGAGVQLFRAGKYWFVPLSELEEKARPLWESIRSAEVLRCAIADG